MTRRVAHWERRLAEWHAAAQTRAFAWGVWDCALAAADAVLAITGADPAAGARGRYADAAGADALLAAAGGLDGLMATLAAAHGWPAIPVRRAQRGDVVLADLPTGPTLGVCVGAAVVAPRRTVGLAAFPLTDRRLARAWAVAREVG